MQITIMLPIFAQTLTQQLGNVLPILRTYYPQRKYGLRYLLVCDSIIPPSLIYTYFTIPRAGERKKTNIESKRYYIAGRGEYKKVPCLRIQEEECYGRLQYIIRPLINRGYHVCW